MAARKKRKSTSKRRTLVATRFQTGSSKASADKKRKALLPGKRRSASGRVYYERRKNRSDTRGSKT